jgi:hypothetical protein
LSQEPSQRTPGAGGRASQVRLRRLARARRGTQEAQHERSIYRQTLRLEEDDDPIHPVIAAAKQRIEELTSRHAAIQNATARLKTHRPSGVRPEEILEMLDGIPDLWHALANADPAELADICDAFQITAVYDKANRTVELSATITPELLPKDKTPTMSTTRSGDSYIAGAGFEPATFGL